MRRQALFLILVLWPAVVARARETETTDGWRVDAGLSATQTSGNSDTSSFGIQAEAELARGLWKFDAGALALRSEEGEDLVAEQYAGLFRSARSIPQTRVALTAGWQGERNRFAGVNFRSVTDVGVQWDALQRESWTVTSVGSLTWTREDVVSDEPSRDYLGALLGMRSEVRLSENASTTQTLRLEPSFEDSDDYRAFARVALQSAMTQRFGLKLAYELRYDHVPVVGFDTTDTLITASVVFHNARGRFAQ